MPLVRTHVRKEMFHVAALRASQGFVPGASPKRNKTESRKRELLLSPYSSDVARKERSK